MSEKFLGAQLLKRWGKRAFAMIALCLSALAIWNFGWIAFYLYLLKYLPLNPPCTPEKLAELTQVVEQNFTFFDYTTPLDQHGAIDLFVSEDDQYVIKIFLPRPPDLKFLKYIPLINQLSAYRKLLKDRQRRYYGCITAYSFMPKESGTLYYHLAPSPGLFNRSIVLIGKDGERKELDLDQDRFVIQKKAIVAKDYFRACVAQKELMKAEAGITNLLNFALLFQSQGIMIPDLRFHKNFGFLHDEPIRLDIEYLCFRKTWSYRYQRHFRNQLKVFRTWIKENSPQELLDFFDCELERLQAQMAPTYDLNVSFIKAD